MVTPSPCLAHDVAKISDLAGEVDGGGAYACDVSNPTSVIAAFDAITAELGAVDALLFNGGSGVPANPRKKRGETETSPPKGDRAASRRPMTDEVELKLGLRPEDADALEASSLLADPVRAEQRSIYFDTPDHNLAKAGLTLRIRRSGRKRIQTVKADGASSAGLFARPEWERPVPDDTPIIDDTTPIRSLLGDATTEIAPAFEIHINRRTWDIREGDAAIEMVLDRGEVVAGDRRSPICEVELELKRGDPRALFALARKLDAVAPVQLGVLTKAERGYGLIGPMVTEFKAGRVQLNRDMTAAEAFQHIVQTCVRQFRLNENLLSDGRLPGAFRRVRIALRRLRSAFSIFRAMLDQDVSPGLRDELRWLASELGEARESGRSA